MIASLFFALFVTPSYFQFKEVFHLVPCPVFLGQLSQYTFLIQYSYSIVDFGNKTETVASGAKMKLFKLIVGVNLSLFLFFNFSLNAHSSPKYVSIKREYTYKNLVSFSYLSYWVIKNEIIDTQPTQIFSLIKYDSKKRSSDYFLDSDYAKIIVNIVPIKNISEYILSASDLGQEVDSDPISALSESVLNINKQDIKIQKYQTDTANGYKAYFKLNPHQFIVFTALYGTWNPFQDLIFILKSFKRFNH